MQVENFYNIISLNTALVLCLYRDYLAPKVTDEDIKCSPPSVSLKQLRPLYTPQDEHIQSRVALLELQNQTKKRGRQPIKAEVLKDA